MSGPSEGRLRCIGLDSYLYRLKPIRVLDSLEKDGSALQHRILLTGAKLGIDPADRGWLPQSRYVAGDMPSTSPHTHPDNSAAKELLNAKHSEAKEKHENQQQVLAHCANPGCPSFH